MLHTTGYSRKTGHAEHEVNGVRAFANIQQRRTNIPDLRAAFMLLYTAIVADWKKTPEERAAEEEEEFKTLKGRVISHVSSDSLRKDRAKGRGCDLTSAAEVVKRVKAVRMRCHTSGVLLSSKSGWNKIHADRIRNARGHVDGNIEWKCALFNSRCSAAQAAPWPKRAQACIADPESRKRGPLFVRTKAQQV